MILLNPLIWYLFLLCGIASFIFIGIYYVIYALIIVILFTISYILIEYLVFKIKKIYNYNLTNKEMEKNRIIIFSILFIIFFSYFFIQYKKEKAIKIKNDKEIEIKVNIEKENYRNALKELKDKKEIKLDPRIIEELNSDWKTKMTPEQKKQMEDIKKQIEYNKL